MTLLRSGNFVNRFWLALMIAGSILRLFVCFQHNPLDYLFSDPARHWLNAERFFAPDVLGAGDPLAYQVYLIFIRIITGDDRHLVALSCGCLSVLMPWTYYRSGRELGLSKSSALAVWAIIAWTPSLFTIYHYTMMETLLLPLVGLSLWMTGRCMRRRDWRTWVAAVLCWTLAILTKPIVLPLAAICMTYVWWTVQRKVLFGVVGVALFLLMLIPNAIRTKRFLGFAAPLGNTWLTKIQHRSGARVIKIEFGSGEWGFASPSVCIQPLEPFSSWAIRRSYEDTYIVAKVDPKNGSEDWRKTYESIHISTKEWFLQLTENTILFFFAPSWTDCNRGEWDGWIAYHSRWLWAPLICFIFVCNVREFSRKSFALLPTAVTLFAFFLAFQNLVTTEGRYRKSLEPLLMLNLVWAIAPTKRVSEKK